MDDSRRKRANKSKAWRARQASVDHVLALSLGGFDGGGNLILAHAECNHRKNDRLPTGCEMIWLLVVCQAMGWPVRLRADMAWKPPHVKRLRRVLKVQNNADKIAPENREMSP